jgi:DNA-binding transcriptional regulator LsrR (DeoR family)
MTRTDELRLISKVARLYYEHGLQQAEIGEFLSLSQATVSRLIKRAHEEKIVRTSVTTPNGVYTELEEALVQAYRIKDAIVADSAIDDDEVVLRDIGAAAAYYLENSLRSGEVIGISSWSATLLAMVESMHFVPQVKNVKVVQILGGVGNPAAETHATRLVSRLAQLVHGETMFLPAPGILGSEDTQKALMEDPLIQASMKYFDQVTLALVGIGEIKPSSLLATSGNVFTGDELDGLREKGAVGDILVRFFDQDGRPIPSTLDERVVGMHLEQLKKVRRAVGIAGGKRKVEAIRAALRGKLINRLITDQFTAQKLIKDH